MHYVEYTGINSFLVGCSRILLKDSVKRLTRGQVCFELPNPIIIKITNPLARIITIPERKWSYTLPYAESLWIASGRNDIALVENYVKRMSDFSDDGFYMRAAYGPRIRAYSGIGDDHKRQYLQKDFSPQEIIEVDQLRFITEILKRDPNTRQAIITITDPPKDFLDRENFLKTTKDFPCTCSLQFLKVAGKLDLIVHMRSNDFVWGASAVNIFNFTFLQEYMAHILGADIGNYYHIVNNFHYYQGFENVLETLADIQNVEDQYHVYDKRFKTLENFDEKVYALEAYEHKIRNRELRSLVDFDDDFFNDWAKVFYRFNVDKTFNDFSNPLLSKIVHNKSKHASRVD